jgi:hypothetical protein
MGLLIYDMNLYFWSFWERVPVGQSKASRQIAGNNFRYSFLDTYNCIKKQGSTNRLVVTHDPAVRIHSDPMEEKLVLGSHKRTYRHNVIKGIQPLIYRFACGETKASSRRRDGRAPAWNASELRNHLLEQTCLLTTVFVPQKSRIHAVIYMPFFPHVRRTV